MNLPKLTDKQRTAAKLLLRNREPFTLLAGGARSGKSYVICRAILSRAMRYQGARFLVARYRLAHARASIWEQTLLPLVQPLVDEGTVTVNRSEMRIKFNKTGAEIVVGGFDDKDRTEKILGTEYLDIYFNEISQIGYDAVQLGLSRLAQNIPGALNKGYFDCNPPSPLHWAHKMFLEKIEPKSGKPLPPLYQYLSMNPIDNADNLPANYIKVMLDNLPKATRDRMRDGLWVKREGTVYDIAHTMIVSPDQIPHIDDFTVGVDFGLNMTAVLIGWMGERVYILADLGGYNVTSTQLNEMIRAEWSVNRWARPNDEGLYRHHVGPGQYELREDLPKLSFVAYCDPAGGERISEIAYGQKADNAVNPGIDAINTIIAEDRYRISSDATGVLSEVFEYRRDPDTEKIVKENDHYCDAKRYGIYSRMSIPTPRVRRIG